MKKHPTGAEEMLGQRLEYAGYKIDRQKVIGFYIADIVIPAHMIIFELDGKHHARQKDYDTKRDEFLKALGFEVIRIPNQFAAEFDICCLREHRAVSIKVYRSALGKANGVRGDVMQRGQKAMDAFFENEEWKKKSGPVVVEEGFSAYLTEFLEVFRA